LPENGAVVQVPGTETLLPFSERRDNPVFNRRYWN